MSLATASRSSTHQPMRPGRAAQSTMPPLRRCQLTPELYSSTHANIIPANRIAQLPPGDAFRELAETFAKLPRNQVFTEECQNRFRAFLNTLEFQVDPAVHHHVPGAPKGYSSSSYDAALGTHVAPRGGYGAPQDVNASFCHDHTDESFEELHPNVDIDTYKGPAPSQGRKKRPRAKSLKAPVPIPAIVVTDTDTAEQALPEQPTQAATAQGGSLGLKVGAHEALSAVAVKGAAEEESNLATQTVVGEDAVPAEHSTMTTSAHTLEKADTNNDYGVIMGDAPSSDTVDFLDASQPAEANAVPQDEGYETQPRLNGIQLLLDGIPFPDDDTPANPTDCGSSDTNDSDNDKAPVVPRTKLTPKKPIATRRSSRISTPAADPQPTPGSLLGKRQTDTDINLEEPKGKRTKATRP
jgi:hypothetical protein